MSAEFGRCDFPLFAPSSCVSVRSSFIQKIVKEKQFQCIFMLFCADKTQNTKMAHSDILREKEKKAFRLTRCAVMQVRLSPERANMQEFDETQIKH